jgi:hypothetical protein
MAGRCGSLTRGPGREHDTTCAKAAEDLLPLLEQANTDGMPTLTDLGSKTSGCE